MPQSLNPLFPPLLSKINPALLDRIPGLVAGIGVGDGGGGTVESTGLVGELVLRAEWRHLTSRPVVIELRDVAVVVVCAPPLFSPCSPLSLLIPWRPFLQCDCS